MDMRGKLKIILLLACIIRFIGFAYGVEESVFFSRKNVFEVERKLEQLKKHVEKSIMSEDGDIIDCVKIYKQPAFNHPALRNHKIQMVPSYNPTIKGSTKGIKSSRNEKLGSSAITVTSQVWHRRGICPKGTIPIRRIRKEIMLKANSMEQYGRKRPIISSRKFKHLVDNGNANLLQQNHSVGILLTEGYSYVGAKGDIKVWNPFVESDNEYSTSQVALKNGPRESYETVESGWAVNPRVYGDNQTRLFVYWTADSSKETGCFDLTCPGFVQTSSEIALGAAINPISLPGQLPFQDPITNNWWVQYGEKINIGYWPPDLFAALKHNAEAVEWGGEVYSSKIGNKKPHTKTQMGTGHFASYVFKDSGWVRRMRVKQNTMELRFPEWTYTYADEYDCYGAELLSDYVEDPEFYYGGPGKNPMCP